eukprot:1159815-Pelagomonas_calceolata.AAC.6
MAAWSIEHMHCLWGLGRIFSQMPTFRRDTILHLKSLHFGGEETKMDFLQHYFLRIPGAALNRWQLEEAMSGCTLDRMEGCRHRVQKACSSFKARAITHMLPASSQSIRPEAFCFCDLDHSPSIKLTTNVARRGGELAATPMARPASAHPTMMLVALCTDISPEAKGR